MGGNVETGDTRSLTTEKPLMSYEQAAEYVGVSTRTIKRRVKEGVIKARRIGHRTVRIYKSDVDKWLRKIGAS